MNDQYEFASHGNYHVFSFQGRNFLYDIERMNCYCIDDNLFSKATANRDEKIFDDFVNSPTVQNGYRNNANPTDTEDLNLKFISLNVAQVCNLSCVYCYGVDGEYGTKGFMSEETAYKSVDLLINESKNSPYVGIIFFGGEPLLNFLLIKKVVSYSRTRCTEANKQIFFSIVTNGSLFGEEVNSFLNENNFHVTVSFDGDENVQNKNRPYKGGQESYSTIKPKIEQFLKSHRNDATARATLTSHSEDVTKIKSHLTGMGFRKAKVAVATLSDYSKETRQTLDIVAEQLNGILADIDTEAKKVADGIEKKEIPENGISSYLKQLYKKNKKLYACGVGRSLLGVSITGELYPCHRFVGNEQYKLGDVNMPDTVSKNQYSKSYTEEHPICSHCWAKYHCGGAGCIHNNLIKNGSTEHLDHDFCTEVKYNLMHAINIYCSLSDREKELIK